MSLYASSLGQSCIKLNMIKLLLTEIVWDVGLSSSSCALKSEIMVVHSCIDRGQSRNRCVVLSGWVPQFVQLGEIGVACNRFLLVFASLAFVQMVLRKMVILVHCVAGGR